MTARRLRFPTAIFNERVATFVDAFFEEMARVYAEQGWAWEEPHRSEGHWDHPDFAVRVAARHKDGATKILELKASSLPGVTHVDEAGRVSVSNEHRWRVDIPRAYPSSLGSIGVRAMTPCYHPRLGNSGRGKACMHVNGEIDRVLLSIVRNILLDPAHVQPPKLFPGRDRGMNTAAMNWFETKPHGIHRRLLQLWARAHGAGQFAAPSERGPGVEVRDA